MEGQVNKFGKELPIKDRSAHDSFKGFFETARNGLFEGAYNRSYSGKRDCDNGEVVVNDLNQPLHEKLRSFRSMVRTEFESLPEDTGDLVPTYYNFAYIYWRSMWMSSDLDRKDLELVTADGSFNYSTQFLKEAFRELIFSNQFALTLDKFTRMIARDGSAFMKHTPYGDYVVAPLNIVWDNAATTDQETSYGERVAELSLDEMLVMYGTPEARKEEFKRMYEEFSKDGFIHFHIVEYWSSFEFDGEIKKGVIHYLDMTRYNESKNFVQRCQDLRTDVDGTVLNYFELHKEESPYKEVNFYTQKEETLLPYTIGGMNPTDTGLWDQGCFELLTPLQAKVNELYLLADADLYSSLGNTLIHEKQPTVGAETDEQDWEFSLSPQIISVVKDRENIRRLESGNLSQTPAYMSRIVDAKGIMQEILGISSLSVAADLAGSTKATTATVISNAAEVAFKSFNENVAKALERHIKRFMLPEVLNTIKSNKKLVVRITGDTKTRDQLIRVAAQNNTYRNSEKFEKDFYKENERYPSEADYKFEIDRQITELKKRGKYLPITVTDDMTRGIQFDMVVDITGEPRNKEQQNQLMLQILQNPFVQRVVDEAKVIEQSMNNSGLDGTSFILTPEEQDRKAKAQAEQEVSRAIATQELAAQQGALAPQSAEAEVNPIQSIGQDNFQATV
jgi:hypothetical protein